MLRIISFVFLNVFSQHWTIWIFFFLLLLFEISRIFPSSFFLQILSIIFFFTLNFLLVVVLYLFWKFHEILFVKFSSFFKFWALFSSQNRYRNWFANGSIGHYNRIRSTRCSICVWYTTGGTPIRGYVKVFVLGICSIRQFVIGHPVYWRVIHQWTMMLLMLHSVLKK